MLLSDSIHDEIAKVVKVLAIPLQEDFLDDKRSDQKHVVARKENKKGFNARAGEFQEDVTKLRELNLDG